MVKTFVRSKTSLHENDRVPVNELRTCIAMALTYHLTKKR